MMGHVQPQVGQTNSKFRLYLHALQQDRTRENISEMFINVFSHVGGLFIVTVVEKAPFILSINTFLHYSYHLLRETEVLYNTG